MAKTMSTNEALYGKLADGPATENELKKALKIDDAEFDAFVTTAKARLWLTQDDSGKTTHYELTDTGRRALAARYDA